jgi:hypothetical protein
MNSTVLGLHNLVRWVVIFVGLWATIKFWRGWLGRAAWGGPERTAARAFVTVLDVQLLLGVLLYAFFSPLTRGAFKDMGAAMSDPPVRYFVVEHVAVMLVSIVAAHIAAARLKRATTDALKYQTAAMWFGIALAAVLGFIPWGRPLLPSF